MAVSAVIARIVHATLQRRRLTPKPADKISAHNAQANARIPPNFHQSKVAGYRTDCGRTLEAAVVWNVIMTCALVVVELRTAEAALKLQVVSDGIPAHNAGEDLMVPLLSRSYR